MAAPFSAKGGVVWESTIDRRSLLKKIMKQTEGAYLTVGIHEDAGTYADNTPEGKTPVPVAKVGFWNEFGTARSPARPFMYPAVAGNQDRIAKMQADAMAAVISGKETAVKALSRIGFAVQSFITNQIKSNTPPDLSPRYAAWRKKTFPGSGARTLIRSGLLLRSIRFRVFVDGQPPFEGEATGAEPVAPLVTEEQRAAYRADALAKKALRAQQRAAAKADPEAAKKAFEQQHRVREPKEPHKPGGHH